MIDWLKGSLEKTDDRILYSLDKIKAQNPEYEICHLSRGGFIILNTKYDHVRFAVMKIYSASESGTVIACIFHGEGPSGSLRECRHTWWGEDDNDGYIFYPSGQIICSAFIKLSEFFDDMIGI
jgi:hypothetical protein